MPTHVEVVTPERVLFSGEADFVVMRAEGGEIMFLPNHAPFVGAVDICTVRIAPAGSDMAASGSVATEAAATAAHHGAGAEGEVRLAMGGGFVHVDDNRLTVLAAIAELASEIDVDRARRALDAAQNADADAGAAAVEAAPTPSDSLDAAAAGEPGIEQSPTMRALVYPDDPEVRERRALARLEAAGVLATGSAAPTGAPAH